MVYKVSAAIFSNSWTRTKMYAAQLYFSRKLQKTMSL